MNLRGVVGLPARVENYILVLLHSVVVQSTVFTNNQYIWRIEYLNIAHEQIVQYNKQ